MFPQHRGKTSTSAFTLSSKCRQLQSADRLGGACRLRHGAEIETSPIKSVKAKREEYGTGLFPPGPAVYMGSGGALYKHHHWGPGLSVGGK